MSLDFATAVCSAWNQNLTMIDHRERDDVVSIEDIYSPENIARSRARAAAIRVMVAEGQLDGVEWLKIADDVDTYADERETRDRVAREIEASRS